MTRTVVAKGLQAPAVLGVARVLEVLGVARVLEVLGVVRVLEVLGVVRVLEVAWVSKTKLAPILESFVLGAKTLPNGAAPMRHPKQRTPRPHALAGIVKTGWTVAIYALSSVRLQTIRGGTSGAAVVTK
jgi:hypothetical protein